MKRPGIRCSRRSEGMEHEMHVRSEESEAAKSVEGPDQVVDAEEASALMEREGDAVASSLKPR